MTKNRRTKQKVTSRELAVMIRQKYPDCIVKLLNESTDAYVYIIHDLTPKLRDAVILLYYLDENIPFKSSFDFYTKNPYFSLLTI